MILKKGNSRQYLRDYKDGKIKQGLGIGCDLDNYLRFKPKQYNGVLGGDNTGKTYFMLWYMLVLSTHHGLKWCVWMDENSDGQAMRDMIQMYSGVEFKKLSHEEIEGFAEVIEQWFTFVDNKLSYTPNELLDVFLKVDADGYFIDPFNQLNHDMEYKANINFIRLLKRWCKVNSKTSYLSMHPVTSAGRKISEYPKGHDWAGQPMTPNKSMAEGGKIFANMADDWINVHRLTKLASMKYFTLIDIDKIKDRDTGGQQCESESPVMLYYNHGLGFTINGVDPMKRKKIEHKPLKPNLEFSTPKERGF